MAEVKRLRDTRSWSAERLAGEMAAVGVPWTRDTVVNLENGRRKRIAAHEVLALAWCLDVDSPVDLLVPNDPHQIFTNPVPNQSIATSAVRAWFEGKTGPLRKLVDRNLEEEPRVAALLAALRGQGLDEETIKTVAQIAVPVIREGDS